METKHESTSESLFVAYSSVTDDIYMWVKVECGRIRYHSYQSSKEVALSQGYRFKWIHVVGKFRGIYKYIMLPISGPTWRGTAISNPAMSMDDYVLSCACRQTLHADSSVIVINSKHISPLSYFSYCTKLTRPKAVWFYIKFTTIQTSNIIHRMTNVVLN
jgi:hypothetical protein